ncbi:MAG: hypothetical protein IKD08_03190 [Alphaproteobacteria bacterium]|nr:hypothetical protein [Alphaproteobacteria bacterium]
MFDNSKIEKITVQPGDAFIKVGGIDSVWKVDRILEYTDLPPHIRLIENGGNNRTATVALSALMDTKSWLPVKNHDF